MKYIHYVGGIETSSSLSIAQHSQICVFMSEKAGGIYTSDCQLSIMLSRPRMEAAHFKLFMWRFFKKLRIELPYDPAILLLGIHTEETRSERDTCTPMFIAAPFVTAKTWKQPRCPSADKWLRKLCYIYTMEYYSAIKKNSFESVLMRWMKLETIIQSEVSQKDKDHYSILTHIYGI